MTNRTIFFAIFWTSYVYTTPCVYRKVLVCRLGAMYRRDHNEHTAWEPQAQKAKGDTSPNGEVPNRLSLNTFFLGLLLMADCLMMRNRAHQLNLWKVYGTHCEIAIGISTMPTILSFRQGLRTGHFGSTRAGCASDSPNLGKFGNVICVQA